MDDIAIDSNPIKRILSIILAILLSAVFAFPPIDAISAYADGDEGEEQEENIEEDDGKGKIYLNSAVKNGWYESKDGQTHAQAFNAAYIVYKIFDANVPKGNLIYAADGSMTSYVDDISYAVEGLEDAIYDSIKRWNDDVGYVPEPHERIDFDIYAATPRETANFLAEMIQPSTESPDAYDYIYYLVEEMKFLEPLKNDEGVPVGIYGNGYTVLEDGYYLLLPQPLYRIVSDNTFADSVTNTSFSSPIFAAVGGDDVIITEKTSSPTYQKYIKENSTQEWGIVADANEYDYVPNKMIATLPKDISTYQRYMLKFVETQSAGIFLASLDGRTYDITVKVNDTIVPEKDPEGDAQWTMNYLYTPKSASEAEIEDIILSEDSESLEPTSMHDIQTAFTQGTLTQAIIDRLHLDCQHVMRINMDLKNLYDENGDKITVGDGDTVSVEYGMFSNELFDLGEGGATLTSRIAYTNNPSGWYETVPAYDQYGGEKGQKQKFEGYSAYRENKMYGYAIELTKTDLDTGDELADVQFKLEDANGNAIVHEEGSEHALIDATATTTDIWETDSDGKIVIAGIDSGTYTVTEITPAGFRELKPFDISLSPVFGTTEESSYADNLVGFTADNTGDPRYVQTRTWRTDDDDTIYGVSLSIGNTRLFMPITGLDGILFWSVAALFLIIGVIFIPMIIRRKKRTRILSNSVRF